MPRVLARLPYGDLTKKVDEFRYEEVAAGPNGEQIKVPADQFCWMNSAYVYATLMTDCFNYYGWCTRIRGAESGGKVYGLPTYVFTTDEGDEATQCPTEVAITERREFELSNLGFLPVCHYKRTDYAVFFGGERRRRRRNTKVPTAFKPRKMPPFRPAFPTSWPLRESRITSRSWPATRSAVSWSGPIAKSG